MLKHITYILLAFLLFAGLNVQAQSLPIPLDVYGIYAPQGNCTQEPRVIVNPSGTFIESKGTKTGPLSVDVCLTCAGGVRYNGIERWLFLQNGKISPLLLRFNADEKPGHLVMSKNDPANSPLNHSLQAILKASSLERCQITTAKRLGQPVKASIPNHQSSTTQFVQMISALMLPAAMPANSYYDWNDLEKVSAIQWAPLPPIMLDKPTADGNYFRRNGITNIGNHSWKVYAAGARTMIMSLHFMNEGAPIGESPLLNTFRQSGFMITTARCSKNPNLNAPKWYKISHTGKQAAFLWVIPANSNMRHWEGFSLALTDQLNPLSPIEQRVYTDHCT